jgi:hypothetical protein
VQDLPWEVGYPSTGPPLGLDFGVEGRFSRTILFGLWEGFFRRLQKQNLPPATLAL